jgi:hypothetical protein
MKADMRRYLPFGVRSLFVAVALVAASVALIAPYLSRRYAIHEMRRAGGTVQSSGIVYQRATWHVGFYDGNLDDRSLVAVVPYLSRLDELELLVGSEAITDESAPALCSLGNVVALSVAGSQLTPAGFDCIVQMDRLVDLDLSGTCVDDESVRTVAQMKSLQRLFVQESRVTRAGIAAFQSWRPDVKVEY